MKLNSIGKTEEKAREKGLKENKNEKKTKLIKIVNNDKNSKQ